MVGTLYVDVDWGLVVKLALPGKVTRRAYKVFYSYIISSGLEFDNPHLKLFYYTVSGKSI
jgi:hypothetical protein